MYGKCCPLADAILNAIVFLAAAFACAFAPCVAQAQNRAAIGCEAIKIDNMSAPVSFEEIGCKCFNKCGPAPQPQPAPAPGPTASNTGGKPPQLAPPTQDQRKFRLYEGRDVNGYDFRNERNTTFSACIDACKNDKRCSSFSFDKWNRVCFLKNTVPTEIRVEPKSIVAVMSTATPSVSTVPTQFQKYNNAVFSDKIYHEAGARSYDACQDRCGEQNRCEAFMFVHASRTCKLLERPSEYFRISGSNTDSGVKRQMPP